MPVIGDSAPIRAEINPWTALANPGAVIHATAHRDRSTAGLSLAVWLVIAAGGWWTVAEVIQELPDDIEPKRVDAVLWSMVHRFGQAKARGPRGRQEYAVTGDCVIPRGATVEQVMKVMNGQV